MTSVIDNLSSLTLSSGGADRKILIAVDFVRASQRLRDLWISLTHEVHHWIGHDVLRTVLGTNTPGIIDLQKVLD